MQNEQPCYVTCRCKSCEGGIEFDAGELEQGEFRSIECPHCHSETQICIELPVVSVTVAATPGKIVSPPNAEVLQWIQTAADNGVIQAQAALGKLYFVGRGMQDYAQAVKWFGMAAKLGHSSSKCNLGMAYAAGWGVEKDFPKAAELWLEAAEQGNMFAQLSIASCYYNGFGIPRNLPAALKWFHRAAAQGEPNAQHVLAIQYSEGQLVKRDYVEAFKWAKLAADQNVQGLEQLFQSLFTAMTEEAVAEGKRKATQFCAVLEGVSNEGSGEDSEFGKAIRLEKMASQFDNVVTTFFQEPSTTPHSFQDIIGQDRIKARAQLAIDAATLRGELLGHLLIVGPHGSGKVTLACAIGMALWGHRLVPVRGCDIEKPADLIGLLTNLEEGDVLLIEEIHYLNKMSETLRSAMLSFKLDVVIDQGPNARRVRLNLPRFTLIGTAIRKERVAHTILSCFQLIESMDAYTTNELASIASKFAMLLNVEIGPPIANQIAQSADGTPLDVLRRLRHIRDYAHVKGDGNVILEVAESALKMLTSSDEAQDPRGTRDAIASEIRREIWRRDQGRCVKCGSRKNLEYDHIIPVSKGGSNTVRNIELLCEACNRSKSDSIQ